MGRSDDWTGVLASERPSLRSLAVRLLGSTAEADDMLQEAWLRTARVDLAAIENPAAWLRTVVSRLCLDELRARRRRPDPDLVDREGPVRLAASARSPEEHAMIDDEVGRALLVVLERLEPVERVAFVLHDVFAVPFEQIAPIVGRTPSTTKKAASRARRKVQGVPSAESSAVVAEQRGVVEAFLAAARLGDLDGVLAVLAPDVVRRCDPQVLPIGVPAELRGAAAVAGGAVALTLAGRSQQADVVFVDGAVGALVAPGGRLELVIRFEVQDGAIAAYDVIADPDRLAQVTLGLVEAVPAAPRGR